ncbi:enoyl-CoA hydratase/isomerase family protein [Streptomyces roseicoloratus]|uniref:enoyl-CoA hydratase/isomerase family protein n=1 Tax=Streptomyces roseicoloratus TaxID=2508722 RepID=UPI00403D5B04
MADTVLYDVSDGLATITINRPEAMNAMNVAAKVALRDAAEAAAADPAVRAVLLTAAGDRAFCVGQDLKEHVGLLMQDKESGTSNTMNTVRDHYNPIVRAIAGMAKPVVAAVNGVAAGAGLRFRARRGLPGGGGARLLQHGLRGCGAHRRLGHVVDAAAPDRPEPGRRPAALPRSIGAQEAYELGIVNRIVPGESLAEEALKLARTLAEGPTVAYAALKESLAFGADHSLAEALEKEDELQSKAGSSEDHTIAVQAFIAKEKPKYLGR